MWDNALVFSIRKRKQSEGSRSREKRDEVGKERAKRAGRRWVEKTTATFFCFPLLFFPLFFFFPFSFISFLFLFPFSFVSFSVYPPLLFSSSLLSLFPLLALRQGNRRGKSRETKSKRRREERKSRKEEREKGKRKKEEEKRRKKREEEKRMNK